MESERINELLNKFNVYWTEFQDSWSDEYW